MLIKSDVKTIVQDLNKIKRPKPNDSYKIASLGHREFTHVNRIKSFFKLIKSQNTKSVILDFARHNEIKIIFNEGCSEYTVFTTSVLKVL